MYEIIAIALICLFVYTGLSKLINFSTFNFQLGQSPYVNHIANFVSWSIPTAELITTLLLVFKRTRLVGFYLSFALMFLFTGYIYLMLHYSYFLPCSCGGILASMSWKQHLYFDAFFTFLSLFGILVPGPMLKIPKTVLS